MISLHIIADNADPARIDRAVEYLKRTRQRSVNIAGGAQTDLAMQLTERVIAEVPGITVMFRQLEDTGIIMKLSPQGWYDSRIAPRKAWLQKNKVVFVVDNESSGSDDIIREYVRRSITIADCLHADGLNGAFCRFATGNIVESQYAFLKPLLDVLQPGDYISPNEYSNAPGKSSAGHIERYKRIEAVAGHPLNVAIGEAGILVDYKANDGFQTIHMTGRDYAAQMIAEEIWYRGGSITRHVFAVGGYQQWASLQPGDDFYEFLESYYDQNPIHTPIVDVPHTKITQTVPVVTAPAPVVSAPVVPIGVPTPPAPTQPKLRADYLQILHARLDAAKAEVDLIQSVIDLAEGSAA